MTRGEFRGTYTRVREHAAAEGERCGATGAVPLRRYDGKVLAAMNIGARLERASAETLKRRFLPLLREEAAALQAQLL
jgi:DNA-binding IclR family transcriptional regulator